MQQWEVMAATMDAVLGVAKPKPKQATEIGEWMPLDAVTVQPSYVLLNPDWFREGDEPQVQIVSLDICYNGGPAQEVSTRFVPGSVLESWESEIARELMREAE